MRTKVEVETLTTFPAMKQLFCGYANVFDLQSLSGIELNYIFVI